MKKTWLFYLNYYLFQWFFFRLARKINVSENITIGWMLIFVWPMTGWDDRPYRYWWKPSWRK